MSSIPQIPAFFNSGMKRIAQFPHKQKTAPDAPSEHRGLLFTFNIQHRRFDLSFFGLGAYMIIGLTPFLCLYDNQNNTVFQDGIITINTPSLSCNKENSRQSRIFSLTIVRRCDMIYLLGGPKLGHFFFHWNWMKAGDKFETLQNPSFSPKCRRDLRSICSAVPDFIPANRARRISVCLHYLSDVLLPFSHAAGSRRSGDPAVSKKKLSLQFHLVSAEALGTETIQTVKGQKMERKHHHRHPRTV